MKKFVVTALLGLALCLSPMQAYAEHSGLAPVAPNANPANLAGETRMLSQRIARTYIQIGLGVMPTVARAQMLASISRFESNLKVLEPLVAYSPQASVAYWELVRGWQSFRAATDHPVSHAAAVALSLQSVEVLDAADRLTVVLEETSLHADSKVINVAGKLRMLSQRLVKAYLLVSWGTESPEIRAELEAAATEFEERLAWLTALLDNTPAMRIELEDIGLQLVGMQNAIAVHEGGIFYRLVVTMAADAILVATDHVTHLYAQRSGH